MTGKEKIKEFLENELSDWSDFKFKIEKKSNNRFEVEIINISNDKAIDYIFDYSDNQLKIKWGESFYDIEYFDYTVKYFWIQFNIW